MSPPDQGAPPASNLREFQHTLATIAREVAGVGTASEWGMRAVAALEGAIKWERVFLYRLREQARVLELVAARGITAEQERASARLSLDGPSLSAMAVLHREPVVSGRTDLPPRVAKNARQRGSEAFAVIPLIARGNVLGTVTLLDSVNTRVVGDAELGFLRAIADQLAVGLDNARLYEAARQREAEARFLIEVTELFGISLDPQVVLETVVQRCTGVLGDACGIFLVPANVDRDDRLTMAAVHHRRPEMVRRMREMLDTLPFRYGKGLAGAVAASGRAVLVPNLADESLHLPEETRQRTRLLEVRSCLIAPLRTRRGVLGILITITTAEPEGKYAALPLIGVPPGGVLTDAELSLAEEVCSRAAAALENAQLYTAAESARLWLRTIFNHMTDGVMVLDPEGRVLERNAAVSRLLGQDVVPGTRPGQAGSPHLDVRRLDGTPMPEDERPDAVALRRNQPVTNLSMVVVQSEEVAVELSANATPLHDEAGRLIGAVTVLRDVSDVRRLERAKEDFLTVASHELRTPLTPLKGLTQALLRHMQRAKTLTTEVDLGRIERYLHTMDGQVDRLAGLVNDLLDVSRIRTGRLQLRIEPVDLVALTNTVLDRFVGVAIVERSSEPAAPPVPLSQMGPAHALEPTPQRGEMTAWHGGPDEEGTRHHIRFHCGEPSLVGQWDAARLEQVVVNLVANSLKYSPDGGRVVITLERWAPAGKPEAHLAVSDLGIGIPTSQIADLFRPFARLANAPADHYGGLGLGLYIAHDIVERHGGRMWAESAGPWQGATFHISLPLS